MSQRVYIETTVVSYLTGWLSRDLVRSAQQRITQEWWHDRRGEFDLVTSELVMLEAAAGDEQAAQRRLMVLRQLKSLEITEDAVQVQNALIAAGAIPPVAISDALHVGICAVSGVEYLLTWNFKHLVNAVMGRRIEQVCRSMGYEPPMLCTPEQL